jgi:hypothetical protein
MIVVALIGAIVCGYAVVETLRDFCRWASGIAAIKKAR